MESLRFLNKEQVQYVQHTYKLPTFIYSEKEIKKYAQQFLQFSHPYGLTVRFAMKANPNKHILRLLDQEGLHIDASSGYEVHRAIAAGIDPHKIQLTAQELPHDYIDLINQGVLFNACSLHQLEMFGKAFPGHDVSIRINPGFGSGMVNRTNVGGQDSGFGIRYAHQDKIDKIVTTYDLHITRLHTHIGSGTDPETRMAVAKTSLDVLHHFPEVTILNLGGGFKIGRMSHEDSAQLDRIGKLVSHQFEAFYQETGRKIHLELEPGTYLVANTGALICTVQDIVDTGDDGFTFLKVDAGMTEMIRTAMYGAQHPVVVVNDASETKNYVVIGHCCESSDIRTTPKGDPETVATRTLHVADIGDPLVVEGVGAYCASMCVKHYNSFPEAGELLLLENGVIKEIRRRQPLEQLRQNEVA